MALAPKFRNWLRTLGAPEDPVATDTTSEWSAMSLLKAIYQALANGDFVSSITFTAESYALHAQRAVAMTANYMKQARLSKVAAAESEADAAAHAGVANEAAHFVAGNVLLGQNAKKDRLAAEAAAVAAAASAASITPEGLILPNQIFS